MSTADFKVDKWWTKRNFQSILRSINPDYKRVKRQTASTWLVYNHRLYITVHGYLKISHKVALLANLKELSKADLIFRCL